MNKEPSTTRQKFPLGLRSCVIILIFSACAATLAFMAVFGPPTYKSLAAEYYVLRADRSYNNLAFEKAVMDYTRAIQMKPDYYEALIYRGSAYAHLEDYERAKLDFETAIDLSSSRGDAYNGLCWFGSLLGDAVNVLDACGQAVITEPNSPYFRDSRGLARALTGDYEGAILDFQFFVDQAKTDSGITTAEVKERIKWIFSLKKGVDPFDSAELQKLLENDILPEEMPSVNT